ncbi:flavin-containing monooxygenase [Bradyrhizobium sp. AZCC 2289]|uniref:flavin-containing monooxygenase n=1 Tax=Bradyrhizobium sp. AZCC 2289 TaxID=3117026 RepID=UPI002FEF1F13
MTDSSITTIRTLVLGAGFGGLGMGAQLKRNGDDDFLILERGNDIGGVWRDNVYPGAACDTEAHLYCYRFLPHRRVSRMYAGRDELLAYMRTIVKTFVLDAHILFESEIISANWHEPTKRWHFETKRGDRYVAEFFVPAWGQLNRPIVPAFNGLDRFRGAKFHSAEWDYAIDLAGKRVASVGNAASAVQYVPEIAPLVGELTVFQRSANWIMPRNQIVFSDEQLDAYERDPESFEASRRHLHAFREAGFQRTQHSTKEQAEGMAIALAHLEAQIPDPQLRAKLTPDYEFACKRILRSDDYFPALTRANVHLETRRIREFDEDGIVTDDRERHGFDIVIFGTGFESQAFHGDLRITGRNGVKLDDAWSDGAQAYLGMAVPDFPNMFMIYGPNTNLNHNSIITMLEIQQNYILQAMKTASADRIALDVDEGVFDRFNEKLQRDMTHSAFSSGCSSWYKNAAGKVINNWSGTADAYRQAAWFDIADFQASERGSRR